MSIAHSLTWRYVIALVLVASLSTAAWFSLHLVITEQASTAAVVNISGRQRMLSQRTALFSNLLVTAPPADRPAVRKKLQDALELMARSHWGLVHGDATMGLPETMSLTVHNMYFDGPAPLDMQVMSYLQAVQSLLLDSDNTAITADHPMLQYITSAAPNQLVASLDKMVKQYQMEGEASVKGLQKAETIFWLVTLLLLALEAALIFHPFIRHVRSVISQLQDVTQELREHENKLTEMVALRTAELESRTKELEEHRQHLEALVAERTAGLRIAKEAAETASRAKSTFLANMSHELRTPLNAIMGMTNMALRHAAAPVQRNQLGKVSQASQHLLGVINDILDLSKIEAGHLSLAQLHFTLSEVMEKLHNLLAGRAQEKGLTLTIDTPSSLADLPLLGDQLRLGQILLNLTGNAIKFTEQGGVTVRLLTIEDNCHNILLRCEVSDTGIGISEKNQQRLFTAFEQADSSMTRKYGGTGLGLAISKRLAQLMEGEIGLDSTLDKGSTFWFSARLKKTSRAQPLTSLPGKNSAETELKARYAGTRVLLVEDEPINQEVSRGMLEEVNFLIDLAEDGAEAVQMASQAHYDLILMDVQMPKLNGTDATRIIRKLTDYAHTPILAMTANAFHEDRLACLEAGMNDHITKPVDPDMLFETLLKWLARKPS